MMWMRMGWKKSGTSTCGEKYGVHLRHLTSMNLSLFIFFHPVNGTLYDELYKKVLWIDFFTVINGKCEKHLQSLSDPLMNVLYRYYVWVVFSFYWTSWFCLDLLLRIQRTSEPSTYFLAWQYQFLDKNLHDLF